MWGFWSFILLLPEDLVETVVFVSAIGLGCILVVATVQAMQGGNTCLAIVFWRKQALLRLEIEMRPAGF
jgi:hypothetical protein